MRRTWTVDFFERLRTEDGPVEVEVEGALDEAMQEAASVISLLNRLGGAVTIAAVQQPTQEIPGPLETDKPTVLYRTNTLLFQFDSAKGVKLAPAEEPQPEGEPEPVETG